MAQKEVSRNSSGHPPECHHCGLMLHLQRNGETLRNADTVKIALHIFTILM